MTGADPDGRVLVLAPTAHDADTIVDLLEQAGIPSSAVATMTCLCQELQRGVGAAVVASEALDDASTDAFMDQLATEPVWSQVPIIIATCQEAHGAARGVAIAETLSHAASVTLLERPFTVEELLGTVRFALHMRHGQYAVRDLNKRLDRQAEDLRLSNEQLSHFATVASHDLRAPLRRIAIYLDLALEDAGQLDEQVENYLKHARESAACMHDLVNDMLAESREGEHRPQADTACLARDALDHALANLADRIAETRARIEIGSLPGLAIDCTSLMRVFQNLVENAIRYRHPSRDPVIHVSGGHPAGNLSTVSVIDNGLGIPEDRHLDIFNRFERSGRTDSRGAGIGLTTVRDIIHRYGGRIWVESRLDEGSTFSFALPPASLG